MTLETQGEDADLLRELVHREHNAFRREARATTILWAGGAVLSGFVTGVYMTLHFIAYASTRRERG